MIKKYKDNRQFEHHLEALILRALGSRAIISLDKNLLENKELVWLGNQVACGVGMQRIDVLFSLKDSEQYCHYPIELKSVYAGEENIRQLRRYMDWMIQYLIPNLPGDICPILITRRIPDNQTGRKREYKFDNSGQSEYFKNLINSFNEFNNAYNCKIKFIEYFIDTNENIVFERVEY